MIVIEFNTRISLETDTDCPDDYDRFFVTSDGLILEIDECEGETKVGTLTAVLVNADRAGHKGLDLWQAADAYTNEIEALTSTFYEDGQLKAEALGVWMYGCRTYSISSVSRLRQSTGVRGSAWLQYGARSTPSRSTAMWWRSSHSLSNSRAR